jgi:hypothetical protein
MFVTNARIVKTAMKKIPNAIITSMRVKAWEMTNPGRDA